MKFNYKKIISVIASAIMLSSTIGFAAAASYPEPFVKSGTENGAIIVGANAAVSDWAAAIDVQKNLQGLVTSTSTTTGASASGGDSANLGTSSRKIYYSDTLNVGKTSISSSELPNVLVDGKITDLSGTEYSYTQSIVLGTNRGNVTFGTSGGDLNDPVLYLDAGTAATAPLYNYTLSFTKNINVSDEINVQGQKLSILGVDYVIGASSTNTTLYLYGSGETVTVAGGESATVTVGGSEHTVELISTSSATAAKIAVDGVSKSVTKNSKYQFAGDIVVYVKDVTHPAYAGDVRNVELIVGQKALKMVTGSTAKEGADETSIKGTNCVITAAGAGGLISGITLQVAMAKSKTDHIGEGESFTDPVFGGLNVQFAGAVPKLDSDTRAKIVVDTDDNAFARVKFTSAKAGSAGEQQITYTYDNDTLSTAVQPLLAQQTVSSTNKGRIKTLEGVNVSEADWVIINQGDAGTILEVTDISLDSPTTNQTQVTFEDVICALGGGGSECSQTVTLTAPTAGPQVYTKSGVNFFGGNGYTINVNGPAAASLNITWNSAGNPSLFPRIKLKDGGWIALLEETSLTNSTVNATKVILPNGLTTLDTTGTVIPTNVTGSIVVNGINWSTLGTSTTGATTTISAILNPLCNFSSIVGPAVLFIEPKKWDDSSYGNFICVPMGTAGTTEIGIDRAILNGTNSGFITLNSDTFEGQAVDKYGAFITDEQRTNQNGAETIYYPSSQMYLDVLFTSVGATVTPGSSGGGGGQVLIVKDTEVDSVKTKNLIVIGGSCINTVAAKILGSETPLCTSTFTEKTQVGAGQYIIKTVASPYAAADSGKVAMLVAGYDAADTTTAVAKALEGTTSDVDTSQVYPITTTTTTTTPTE